MIALPPSLLAYAARGPEWVSWLDALPRLVRDLVEEWDLVPDGGVQHGYSAFVLPVRTADGEPAVLKVGWPHWEAEHEAVALQTWHGEGAVWLLRADPHRWALLLERLQTQDLTELWDLQACEVVGGLYGRLHVPATPQLRTLSAQAERWADELGRVERGAPVPHRLVEQARSLARDFAVDPGTDGRLIHTDLHFQNVLAGHREPWLAIDPKPLSGDPHYEMAPMLWNEPDVYAGRLRDGVRARLATLTEAAALDADRARDWVIVRMLVNVKEELATAAEPDREMITLAIAIAKAVQD